MASVEAFLEILKRPTIWGMMQFLGPVWFAFVLGVIMGWVWRPRWARASLGNCKFDVSAPSSPSTFVPAAPVKDFGMNQSLDSCLLDNNGLNKEQKALPAAVDGGAVCSQSELIKEDGVLVMYEDFEHLRQLVERKDGGPPWKHMMDRSTQNMIFQSLQRDPETGPPQYCSRTVYEDATPELLRDFFWDDEFRTKWDDMIVHAAIIEECPTTGTMMVHWIRKFPFFCSDREYIIGRRIWESGRSYYCVTKGVPCVSVPRRDKPRRVDLYYSSWYIRAVESRQGNGQLSACEVILFHHEDMGIPWEIAKFGVRQGMWGAAKNVERGFRAYQKHRASLSGSPVSHHAFMAQINTKIDPDHLKTLEGSEEDSSLETTQLPLAVEKPKEGVNIPKLLIIGGAVAIAFSLDRGLFTKTLIFGVARKFGNIGRKGCPSTN
ncbi:hypothetical protein ABFS83_06G097100 [Erythranthe nasuta]